jgi:hypothetical protein
MTEWNGSDSKAAATVNCSSHWFDEDQDLVAVGWYEQGTRFLDVHDPRDIRQVGFYLPANGSTWAAVLVAHRPHPQHRLHGGRVPGRGRAPDRPEGRPSTMPTLTAPIPASWFTASPTYVPPDTWQFACP